MGVFASSSVGLGVSMSGNHRIISGIRKDVSYAQRTTDPIMEPDIDRLLAVREKIFSDMFSGFFYSVETRGLSLTEFKAMALRLYVEMAFIRAYLIENSPALWPQKSEDLWTHHTPKALRKLNPAFYGQLLGKKKKEPFARIDL